MAKDVLIQAIKRAAAWTQKCTQLCKRRGFLRYDQKARRTRAGVGGNLGVFARAIKNGRRTQSSLWRHTKSEQSTISVGAREGR